MRWCALLLVLVLGGCGIQPTDPVFAGEPPVGAAPGPILFFVRDGHLDPVVRAENGRLGSPADALTALLNGPTPAESAAGYYSAIPLPAAAVSVSPIRLGEVTVALSLAPAALSPTAIDQVVCTVVAVEAQLGAGARGLGVRLTGIDASGPPRYCPAAR